MPLLCKMHHDAHTYRGFRKRHYYRFDYKERRAHATFQDDTSPMQLKVLLFIIPSTSMTLCLGFFLFMSRLMPSSL